MVGPLAGSSAAPHVGAPSRGSSLDQDLSSTTPDVRRDASLLGVVPTLGWATAIGAGLGALLLRGGGSSAATIARATIAGAAAGAATGSAALVLDRLTGGAVQRRLDYLSLERSAQIRFVLSHPLDPWIAGTGLRVARDAKAAQAEAYGSWDPKDGAPDAFRHTYAAALFTLRAIRDHGETPESARRIAVGAGDAHEIDNQDSNDDASREMDRANNRTGASIAADGRARPGEDADARGFVTEAALRDRVLAGMSAGSVMVVERSGGAARPRATNAADLPRHAEASVD